MGDYSDWCDHHGVGHGHCPLGCEHPQPVTLKDGRFVCGRCLFVDDAITEMAPCHPEQGCVDG